MESATQRLATAIAFLAALIFSILTEAQTPAHIGRHDTRVEDSAAIMQVTRDFQSAIIDKNPGQLSALLLNSNILFTTPASPQGVKRVQEKIDVNFDGVRSGGASEFLQFIANAKEPIEERFYNIKITQDGHLAWVMFDFEFLSGGKVENHGIETWQMIKASDGKWKILSVVWSSHGAPTAGAR
jgi:ketosteroid isomerase-like protein